MKKKALKQYGIWIDHKNAFILSVVNGTISNERIKSGINSRIRFRGEGTSKTGDFGYTINREREKENKMEQEVKNFLRAVVKKIALNTEAVFILGPADMKMELKKMLSGLKAFEETYITTEAAEKMTIRELIAKVKDHFAVVEC